jgi:hypothetical protein
MRKQTMFSSDKASIPMTTDGYSSVEDSRRNAKSLITINMNRNKDLHIV